MTPESAGLLSVDIADVQEHGESFRWQLCLRGCVGPQSAADASNLLPDVGLVRSRELCGHRVPTILAVSCLAAALGYLAVCRKPTAQESGKTLANFEALVQADFEPFVKAEGHNCYLGHGATPLDNKDDAGIMTLQSCQEFCAGDGECEGIVFARDTEPTDCWVRKNINLDQCDWSDSWDSYLKPSTAQQPATAPAPADDFAPSSAPLYEFYMYRATGDGDIDRYPAGNMNTANLDGLTWYLLNEVVTQYSDGVRCPRKFDISQIHRFKVKYRAPDILLTENQHFGVRYAYDYGECQGRCFDDNHCTGEADCAWHYDKYGYIIGCNRFADHYPWPSWETSAPQGVWYSLPLQGKCDGIPTGTRDCTWSYDYAGFITLKDLESTTPGDNNCCDGSCSNYWDDEYNPDATSARVSKILELFQNKYPDWWPANLDEPWCDFNRDTWYADDDWPRT